MTLLELSYQRRKAKAEATGLLDTRCGRITLAQALPSKSDSTR